MKQKLGLTLFTLFCLLSCSDNIPRDRPNFIPDSNLKSTDDTPTEEEEEVELPKRPDKLLFLQGGHCGCLQGEPVTLGACTSFCAQRNDAQPTLYVNVEVDESKVAYGIDSLFKWCTSVLTYTDPETGDELTVEGDPGCRVQLKDTSGQSNSIDFIPESGSSIAKIDITNFEEDKTYRVSLVEIASGASSSTIQVRRVSESLKDPVGGPLWVEPTFQYSCMLRAFFQNETSGQVLYEKNNRVHFYFIAETRPEPLPSFFPNIYCHDYQLFGERPISNPLLEETPGHFFVWNKWDPRFYDQDENNQLQIHDILEQKIREQGTSISETPKIFQKLDYLNGPTVTQSSGGSDPQASGTSTAATLGYYMTPFIDFEDGFKSYCPTRANYYGTNPLLIAMRDVVGIDTQALYIAKQEGVCDFMLVSESKVRPLWFYIENGRHIEPNSETIVGKQIQFYWPADANSPFVKKSEQRTYTIISPSQLGSCNGENGNIDENAAESGNNSYPPHDKRIGCIPAL